MEKVLKIGSAINNLHEVEVFLNSFFNEFNISRKLYCKVYLAVNEAVNNAIQHGNKYNLNKFVLIEFQILSSCIEFKVQDEGDGFDFINIDDPTNIENISKESGRGIFIMNQYADAVIFDKNGTLVKLIFNKSD